MTYLQAILLGAIQGLTELFPVSSLGHSVILPGLLGWNIDQGGDHFLIFLVATHLATSLVLLCFFYEDWVLIAGGMIRSLKNRKIDVTDGYEALGWLLVVATVPAGILGLLFEDRLKALFASPLYAALFLCLNGFLLFGAEFLKKKENKSDKKISKLTYVQAVKIGFAQALALMPGFSRTGATLGGGLLVGLDHEDAARFSFLLATPIIFAAAALKLPELAPSIFGSGSYDLLPLFFGFVASAIAAYISVRFLTKYFKTNTLVPFAIYCIIAGAFAFAFFIFRS